MPGEVFLVGAGPGDPELLTVKAAGLIQRADAILFDRLVDARVLALAKPKALLEDVGKQKGVSAQAVQHTIQARLAQYARQGLMVVRLKGGDPYVFGRGGEEALALTMAGIRWSVVPGISSALAGPALARIPVTFRGVSDSVTVLTAHHAQGESPDWRFWATVPGTLVILMGMDRLADIAGGLMAGGKAAQTPVAVIRWASWPHQQAVRTVLDELVATCRQTSLGSPAVLVIGPTVPLLPEGGTSVDPRA